MNKKQLVAKLSGSLNLSKADAERTFDTITNTILDALKSDDSVKIAGFGTYKVAKRKARIGRNPRTGEQIQIAASQKVKFLPAKALKEICLSPIPSLSMHCTNINTTYGIPPNFDWKKIWEENEV